MGSDGIIPFIIQAKKYGKGIFVLVKTSNPSSGELQDLEVVQNEKHRRIYEIVALLVNDWGKELIGEYGYSSVGAVVGATYPAIAEGLRRLMTSIPFLVPGFGAQGATASDVAVSFDRRGLGAVINSSRKIFFGYRYLEGFSSGEYAVASRESAKTTREQIVNILEKHCPDLEY